MVNLLFTLIAIVILLPILLLLPIGFSVRGKITIVIASLLIVLLGLMAAPVFPFWQTILIEVLVVGIVSYLLNKKMAAVIYAAQEDINVFEEEERTKQIIEGMDETYSYIAHSEKTPKLVNMNEQVERYDEGMLETAENAVGLANAVTEPANKEMLMGLSVEEVAVALQEVEDMETELEQAQISFKNESVTAATDYLADLEEYLTNDSAAEIEDRHEIDDLPISLIDVESSDLELQLIETASFDEPTAQEQSDVNLVFDELDDELPELIFSENPVQIEGQETHIETFETEELEIIDYQLEDVFKSELEEGPEEEDDFETESDRRLTAGVPSDEHPIKIKFNLDDDDDDDFWKSLLEDDDEEDKKESKPTDKLEKVWKRTGLAK